jgi:Outer membrane protein beta-barrel domain
MTRRITRATALAAPLVFLLCSPASAQTTRLQEFPFGVGAGGSAFSDTMRPAGVKTFSTGGFHAFFELALDPGVLLQARYERFQIPGSTVDAPRKDVDAGNVTVGYVFREEWWEAGLFAGVGLYGLAPRSPEAGQTPVDVRETVFGWNGGTLLVFQLARRWDLRVEAAGYLLQTVAQTKLVRLGGSVAYHF